MAIFTVAKLYFESAIFKPKLTAEIVDGQSNNSGTFKSYLQ